MNCCQVVRSVGGFVCALILAAAMVQPASATMITLSTHATGGANPALFDATVDVVVSGSTLNITVTNDTASPNAFRINQIFFNASSELTSISPLFFPAGWAFSSNQTAGSFGVFEHAIKTTNNGANSAAILPGGSITFGFAITGAGVTANTFLNELSTGPDRMIFAARFVTGSNGNNGEYGGINSVPSVPAPGTLALLAGAILIGLPRRRLFITH